MLRIMQRVAFQKKYTVE